MSASGLVVHCVDGMRSSVFYPPRNALFEMGILCSICAAFFGNISLA